MCVEKLMLKKNIYEMFMINVIVKLNSLFFKTKIVDLKIKKRNIYVKY